MGVVVVCIGCREPLDGCACDEIDEAEQAALLAGYDVDADTSGSPKIEKCRRCYDFSMLETTGSDAGLCLHCIRELKNMQ